ncbi:hypothetical protein [Peptostreptococcus equinus]|uniref:Uncharacterized protein n=1 Tax=Peptostreptococcus equinus TaxID=3003601 RepID=A0ABY7JKZ2_9FIRM|nr:hypothetical protein [Peptostreptococcus sp. CBA3647]WAW14019.1 hypothetical protein O0R46_05280 [Peptostreptococcus sp. CBA3647]
MKKKLFATGILLAGVLTLSPISMAISNLSQDKSNQDVMYASVEPKKNTTQKNIAREELQSEYNYDESAIDDKVINKDDTIVEKQVTSKNVYKQENKDQIVDNNQIRNKNSNVVKNNNAIANKKQVVVNNGLTKEEAEKLLKNRYGKNTTYDYLGTESDFGAIKVKGHEGYMYFPNKPTDYAYFVDKHTNEVYYYHPSGYFDIAE